MAKTPSSYIRETVLFNKSQRYIFEWLRKKSFDEKRPRSVIIRELLEKEINGEKK